jgi:hypothetical protein
MTHQIRSLAGVVLVLAAAGCQGPEAQLEGKWKFSDLKLPAGTANSTEIAKAKTQLGSTSAEFKPDKSFSLTGALPVEGTWTLSGHEVSMTISKIGGQDVAQLKRQLQAMGPNAGPKPAEHQLGALDKPIAATLGDDGKTLTIEPSEGMKGELVLAKDTGAQS